jgi:hypothetical protein
LCNKYSPGFPISHIGFSISYAEKFLSIPNVSFNMLQGSLMGPFGASFLRKAKELNRPVFAWTVNEEKRMRWCIREELDGTISDNPKMFLEVCDRWQQRMVTPRFGFMELFAVFRLHCMVVLFSVWFRWKYGSGVDKRFIKQL